MSEAADIRETVIDTSVNDHVKIVLQSQQFSRSVQVFTIVGDRPGHIEIDYKAVHDSNVTVLTINHCEAELVFDEKYDIEENSEVLVAHAQLNRENVTINSEYNLLGEESRIRVQTVSLTSSRKLFRQKCNHISGHTTAEVNNYGVVLSNGYCDMVVENTINKGAHGSRTHQTSRLLTNDKTATGKILPVLYIYDNEVEASHAATLGQPDDEQLYYLRSRGLSHGDALKLIIIGYLMPITKIIDNEEINRLLQEEIELKVSEECTM